jgi:ABC-type transporter Mla MlaB component
MLRITQVHVSETVVVLRLEGKLLDPWLEELKQVCGRFVGASPLLQLDLSGVSFVDRAGTTYLRTLLGQGVEFTNCSPFVAELLKLPLKEEG